MSEERQRIDVTKLNEKIAYQKRSKAKIKAFEKICQALDGLTEFDKACVCRAALIITEQKEDLK